MKYIIFPIVMGIILAMCGMTAYDWQFYAILIPTNSFLIFFTK